MTYGSQIWAAAGESRSNTAALYKPLATVQNRCLRKAVGSYKRTPIAAIERESGTPPIDLYIRTMLLQRAVHSDRHDVTKDIQAKLRDLWESARRIGLARRRGRPPMIIPKPGTPTDRMRAVGQLMVEDRRARRATGRDTQQTPGNRQPKEGRQIQATSTIKEIGQEMTDLWKKRWEEEAVKPHRKAPTWKGGWEFVTVF
ncbi:hypothetical protein EJ02DRAFT_422875 [Clathrospora elynae]|uniref:Uncharacterized protein n=1 Tax=Clathrospora elynae TaxID=706981 RepID=A0A6A5SSK9_9PLEO|nr:hypothetical protein EJ02DRAFT_422875 [Clathrospora elynae]